MEHEVTQRLLHFFQYLKSKRQVKSASAFAVQLGVSTSTMTELKKGRSQVGLKTLQQTVKLYRELDPRWLLTGEGSMVLFSPALDRSRPNYLAPDADFTPSTWEEGETGYREVDQRERLIAAKEEVIRAQQTTIATQQQTIISLLQNLEKNPLP